ncbi:MAG: metal-sensing transcriptional repressor [Selenomonadaceae bacterium]|nr:metal-sensing transcriptional repressor [Selenomonadaceae bacterium]MBQ1915192.1 metal-sensing transcriptional repressor [Selenomonadaceae bacterium]
MAEHEHILADGTVIRHTHAHGQGHGHVHSHTQTKAVLNRMARVIGHMESIRRMVEDGRDCSEVLIQISAVNAALQGVAKTILKDHLEHCIVDAVQEGDKEAIEKLNAAIDQFIR